MSRRLVPALAIVVAALPSLPTTALAADSKIRGSVSEQDGDPIGGAHILIQDPKSGRKYRLQTKKNGTFYQRGVRPSTYTMRIQKDGYVEHIVEDVRVQAGLDREFEIVLHSAEERRSEIRQERIAKGDTYLAGYEAFQAGDYDEALANADKTIAKTPEDPKGYDMKAKALIGLKRYVEAIPVLEKEMSLSPDNAELGPVLAAVNYNAGVGTSRDESKLDETIAYWERSLELGYSEPALPRLLGHLYMQKQNFSRSLELFELYLAGTPSPADAAEIKTLVEAIQKIELGP